ncbi:MAG: NifU family protein [Myxococcales bacterium]|nr:NifU family protein [Myxococcales bacterium]MDD9966946.1 NifU family protein [Myxococcales bacterium]
MQATKRELADADSVEDAVKHVIDRVLRPLIEADGGAIELIEVTEAEIVIRLTGACSGCPGRPYTLDHVIRPALRKHLGRKIAVVPLDAR